MAGKRGVGIEKTLAIFEKIKSEFNVPVLTDVHEKDQCSEQVVDCLQIPAFLCRQTDLLYRLRKLENYQC